MVDKWIEPERIHCADERNRQLGEREKLPVLIGAFFVSAGMAFVEVA